MAQVTIFDLIRLSGSGVDEASQGSTFTFAGGDLVDVVDGLVFETELESSTSIPAGSTASIDGIDYVLSEVYSFWGEVMVTDPDSGDEMTIQGQTLALTLEDGEGNTINFLAPSDNFVAENPEIEGLEITSIGVVSPPFLSDGINQNADQSATKLSGDDDIKIPCFTAGTLIDTIDGPKPVETIMPGDMVLTRDSGYMPVTWAGARAVSLTDMMTSPDFAPVRIAAGALGNNLPARDMMVSPQHRMLICGSAAELMFGEHEVLVPAIHLVGLLDGVSRVHEPVTYIHVMCETHQVLRGDGAWSESFQPGAGTLAGLDAEQRAEIFALFPDLAEAEGQQSYVAARITLREHEARALLAA